MAARTSDGARVRPIDETSVHSVAGIHMAPVPDPQPKPGSRLRIAIAAVVLFVAIGPMLLWRGGWSAFSNDDQQIAQYIEEDRNPRIVEAAVTKIGERIRDHKPASRWYPELLRLAKHPDQNVRRAAAWALGQDAQRGDFHRMLTAMLVDSSAEVSGTAAISLLNFGDTAGHQKIVDMLAPVRVSVPHGGRVIEASRNGDKVRGGEGIVRLRQGDKDFDVPAPITGHIRRMMVRADDMVTAGVPVAIVDPSPDNAYQALHALYMIGEAGDLEAVTPYLLEIPDMPVYVRDQARLTEQAIRSRMK